MIIKSSNFSSQGELIFKFIYAGRTYHTMPKDGAGQHAVWEQVFELPKIKEQMDSPLCLEGHEGSPLDS